MVYGNLNIREKIEESISDGLGDILLSTRLFQRLIKRVFLWQSDFNLQGAEEMTGLALDLTARALQDNTTTAWSTVFLPDEILYAADMTPFSPEIAAGAMAAFGRAEEMLQEAEAGGFATDTCSFHRCAGGLDIRNYLPEPDFIAASTHLCDGAPQLFKYQAQKHGVEYYVLDVPADDGCEAEDYLASQIEEMLSLCQEISGVEITQSRLEEVFNYSNQARREWLEVQRLRQKYPPVLTSPAALAFVYLHFLCFGHERTPEILATLQDDLHKRLRDSNIAGAEEIDEARADRADESEVDSGDLPHLLWLHLRPYFSREMFDFIGGRAHIVFEEMNNLFWPPLNPDRPYRSLARKILSHPGVGPIENRVDAILEMIDDYCIDGVVHFSHWGCRQSAGGTYQLKKSLKDAGVPFLDLQGDCIDPGGFSSGQIRTRLESFLELLEMRSQAI